MMEMRTKDNVARESTGSTALVVQDYFKTLAQENASYTSLTPEQEARFKQQAEERRLREEARRNALTPAERATEDKELEAWRKKEARAAARRKGPRPRTLPMGIGSNAGFAAGDRVQLRKEIK